MEAGYAGTSLDVVLTRAGVTKGAFFHHFESKQELAKALVVRHNERDKALLTAAFERAGRLSRDPLQQHLILIGLLGEQVVAASAVQPGCLLASYCYELGLMSDDVKAIMLADFGEFRQLLERQILAIIERYPPRMPVESPALADMPVALLEGAFVLARVGHNQQAVEQMFEQYRNYIELLFSPDLPGS